MSDEDLLAATRALLRKACAVEADLLLHLGEIEERRLYLECAYSSMFAFCVGDLGFSEDAAYTRIFVARAARRLPAIVDELRSGRVHLFGLRLLAPHLTAENHVRLLADAEGKSKRQIEELVARIAPQPPVPTVIRKLPTAATLQGSLEVGNGSTVRPEHRPVIAPLSAETYRIQFTASRAMRDKLKRAQDLLRHRIPDGDPAAILEKALDLLIERVEKERFGTGGKSASRPQAERRRTRHIPAAIRRSVVTRDQGRCTFVDDDGRRCAETGHLEFDHVDGYARNPVHTVEALRLCCRAHNQHAAEKMYGRPFMDRARARNRQPTCSGTTSTAAPDPTSTEYIPPDRKPF